MDESYTHVAQRVIHRETDSQLWTCEIAYSARLRKCPHDISVELLERMWTHTIHFACPSFTSDTLYSFICSVNKDAEALGPVLGRYLFAVAGGGRGAHGRLLSCRLQ